MKSHKNVLLLLCLLIFFLIFSVYEFSVIKKEQNEIEALQKRLTALTKEQTKNETTSKEQRKWLSITYKSSPEEYFSMQKTLWNDVFNKTESTADMNDWILESTDKWEEEINKNINLLKGVTTAEEYNLLQISQKKWEEYKTAHYNFVNKILIKPTGNMWESIRLLYILKLIEDRAETLHSLYEDSCDLQKI